MEVGAPCPPSLGWPLRAGAGRRASCGGGRLKAGAGGRETWAWARSQGRGSVSGRRSGLHGYRGWAGLPPPAPLPRPSRWTAGLAMRVPSGRAAARVRTRGANETPSPAGPRSSIRNAHSIHQRSRKRLSQDTYRRNSVRFTQQRRRQRPGPHSPGSALSECGPGPGGGAGRWRRGLGGA